MIFKKTVTNDSVKNKEEVLREDKLEEINREKVEKFLKDDDKAEQFVNTLIEEINTDEENISRKGKKLIQAYVDGDVENFLYALCGWSFNTLLVKADSLKE